MQETGYKTKSPTQQAIGDLGLIAFYYLLRVGEYTKPRYSTSNGVKRRSTRTVQFRVADIGFFYNGQILPRKSSLEILSKATSCTLKITNQKNGRMGQTIHHHAIKGAACPIKALARRVHHIFSNGGSAASLICDVYEKKSWTQITSRQMLNSIREAVHALKLHNNGIDADLIGAHSLRAGGAMALKLNGANDTTIMKMGRWSSLTFLQYIHNQIAHLSTDLSNKMSTKIDFINIAAIEKP
jgi:hypothetical protein